MMTRELGVTHMGPDKMLFVVVEATEVGVVVLVLQDNPAYMKPMLPGTVMNVLEETVFWEESVPFVSLRDEGKVSS